MQNESSKVVIYTDGSCKGNPGQGGWGVVLYYKENSKELFGYGGNNTTNNIMEMTAVINGLEALKRPCDVILYSDSKYVIEGITKWMQGWKRNGWRTSYKQDVKNKDLWLKIDDLNTIHNIEWRWVKGHSNDHGNNLADELANRWRNK